MNSKLVSMNILSSFLAAWGTLERAKIEVDGIGSKNA